MGRRWSPYVYGFNNPVRFVDPDGMWSVTYEGEEAQEEFRKFKQQTNKSKYLEEKQSESEGKKEDKKGEEEKNEDGAFYQV